MLDKAEQARKQALLGLGLSEDQVGHAKQRLELSPAESRVLQVACAWPELSAIELGDRLELSRHTVENHWRTIYEKLREKGFATGKAAAIQLFVEVARSHSVEDVGVVRDNDERGPQVRAKESEVDSTKERQPQLTDDITAQAVGHHDPADLLKEVRSNDGEDASFGKLFISAGPALPRDRWYVEGLRTADLEKAYELILRTGVVQILGPHGIGKSTLSKDLIQRIIEGEPPARYREFSLSGCTSVLDVCSVLVRVIHEDYPAGVGEETILEHLASEDFIYWIKCDGDVPLRTLEQFGQLIGSLYSSRPSWAKARWIIETHHPLHDFDLHQVSLGPLNNYCISRILDAGPPGGMFQDPEEVISLSAGNPSKAIRLWRSQSQGEVDASDDLYRWFRYQLTAREIRVLPVLCMVVSASPLGISTKALEEWTQVVCPDLPPSEVSESLDTLLRKLETLLLARVDRIDREKFGGLLDQVLPERASLNVLADIDGGLVEAILRSVEPAQLNNWKNELGLYLAAYARGESSLAQVTMGLYTGNLEPFFRSSFRITHRGWTLAWIDRTGWLPDSPTQSYLLKVLRILERIARAKSVDIGSELVEPQKHDVVQRYAFDIVRASMVGHLYAEPETDLPSWLAEAENCNDLDLQVEMLSRAAGALLNRNDPVQAWGIINKLRQRDGLSPSARCLVLHMALTILNRKKVIKQIIPNDSQVTEEIIQLSAELIENGIAAENLSLVANALFYYVRACEYQMGRSSPRKVLGYLEALEFIEDTSPIRRVQALLTMGSIHRHYCRATSVEWPEYSQHLKAGLYAYHRAFRAAVPRKQVTHLLNSVAYMMEFCNKSMRFADLLDARRATQSACQTTLGLYSEMSGALSHPLTRSEDKNVLRSIEFSLPVLRYVASLGNATEGELDLAQTEQAFSSLQRLCLEVNGERPLWAAKKRLEGTIDWLGQAIEFGQHYVEVNARLLDTLRPYLIDVLENCRIVSNTKEWQKLQSLVSL